MTSVTSAPTQHPIGTVTSSGCSGCPPILKVERGFDSIERLPDLPNGSDGCRKKTPRHGESFRDAQRAAEAIFASRASATGSFTRSLSEASASRLASATSPAASSAAATSRRTGYQNAGGSVKSLNEGV